MQYSLFSLPLTARPLEGGLGAGLQPVIRTIKKAAAIRPVNIFFIPSILITLKKLLVNGIHPLKQNDKRVQIKNLVLFPFMPAKNTRPLSSGQASDNMLFKKNGRPLRAANQNG